MHHQKGGIQVGNAGFQFGLGDVLDKLFADGEGASAKGHLGSTVFHYRGDSICEIMGDVSRIKRRAKGHNSLQPFDFSRSFQNSSTAQGVTDQHGWGHTCRR